MKRVFSVLVAVVLAVVVWQPVWAANPGAKAAKNQPAEPGAVVVAATVVTATVDAIDAAKRTVTLKRPDGQTKTLKAGPEVRNFDQIKVGDQVKATFVEELAVFVKKSDAPASTDETTTVALAPKGAKPGILVADTQVVTAKIEAVSYKNRTVTLRGPEGNKKTLKVGKNVANFKEVKKGDEVSVRFTEALAIIVEKP